jgi:hypothetical protein
MNTRWFLATLLVGATMALSAHERVRTPVRIPDIPGYRTLKCDFHTHTVFSDGKVWPDIRAEEAWREGLDALAITDHIEYQPHKDDLPTAHNRSHQIAASHGEPLRLLVIRGSEITRAMPPGHLNAIFLADARRLDTKEWRDAVAEAHRQGAFIFWNHPAWTGQQPDGVARWYPEHTELVASNRLHGIEVVNGRDYYPQAHAWCLEKNLTMLSNSDIHNPLNLDYDVHEGDHRPVTLVFATDNTPAAIKEALFARRTAAYSGELLVGREEFVKPIFERSLRVLTPSVPVRGKDAAFVQIQNDSDLTYDLRLVGEDADLSFPRELKLPAGKTALLEILGRSEKRSGEKTISLVCRVKNLLVLPNESLTSGISFAVTFVPK